MKKTIFILSGLLLSSIASATLPPPSPEAQKKAAEAKQKSAWSDKVAAYELCQTQNRIAEKYLTKNNKPKPNAEVPPCQNPGPYVPS